MSSLAYTPGTPGKTEGPLARFLPALDAGSTAAWLRAHIPTGSWVLDPFGFSPELDVEAAAAGYRVLVTVNNPITRLLLDLRANAPSREDMTAALAALASSKKGDTRLEAHLRALYSTRCERCGQGIEASAYIWKKDALAPHGRIYTCKSCGDSGERATTQEDAEHAAAIGALDAMHRARAVERVAGRQSSDRVHAEEAIRQYLPRPLYVLTTILNRIEGLALPPARERALRALALYAADSCNALWPISGGRQRPKVLTTPGEFRESNVWLAMEEAADYWADAATPVACVSWPAELRASGIRIFDGRLRELTAQVQRKIPVAAVIGSIPRPNQAFWTLSAVWAGWMWGHEAVQPYHAALHRRRYDWGWNAAALGSAFKHVQEVVPEGTPFFGLLPEPESDFLTSTCIALSHAGMDLAGLAIRSTDEPAQILLATGAASTPAGTVTNSDLQETIELFLQARGEPAGYLQASAAGLELLTNARALGAPTGQEDATLRHTRDMIETAVKTSENLKHYSSGESVEAGNWAATTPYAGESLTDRVEHYVLELLRDQPTVDELDIQALVCRHFTGLMTPSRELVLAILGSYAEATGTQWRLRDADEESKRQADIREMVQLVKGIGAKLGYGCQTEGRWLMWDDSTSSRRAFTVHSTAQIDDVMQDLPLPVQQCVLVLPGSRAGLLAYKTQHNPALEEQARALSISKFRLWRALDAIPMLTRELFAERLAGDPVEGAQRQMQLF